MTKGGDVFDAKAHRERDDDGVRSDRDDGVAIVSKSSVVIEHLSSSTSERIVTGHERGSFHLQRRSELVAPSPLDDGRHVEPDADAETVRAAGRDLRERAEAAIGSVRVAVRVVSATIERELLDGTALRERLDLAELRVGDRPDAPRWARATLVDVVRPMWPDGWIEAAANTVSARPDAPAATGPVSIEPDRPWVLAPFAAADLLRAISWPLVATPPEAGAEVAGRGVELRDPGFPGRGRGAAFDAIGRPTRPLDAIVHGKWSRGPGDPGVAERFGTTVAPSWRDRPAPGWRSLDLSAPRVAPPPGAPVVDEVRLLAGVARAFGRVGGEGERRPFDLPFPPPVSGWLRLVEGACGPAVVDATGPVVRVPPLVIGGPA